ncbi:MAG: TonB-dependent receptor [Bacteroidales bacterium]|nr:TonB-dependent receptor [Bacteroidales bacterium]
MIKMKHSSLRRLASALCGLMLCMPMLFAQQTITVKGKVIDPSKQPVIGAAIIQVGTTNGAATDIDGNFTLTAPAGADLEVSSIGYSTVTVKAAANLTITLQEENTTLDETVVVGYGTQKKASLTSSIANIRSEELTATKSADVTASLQGKVPGLLIHQVSGGAGDFDTDLNIRGFAGEPIIVVDGVVRTAQRRGRGFNYGGYSSSSSAVLSQLNPEDIESISVLKDASASIYGMGAGNGVILVTTKKGSISKPNVRYSNTLSFGLPTALPRELGLADYMRYRNEMLDNSRATDGKYSDEDIQHAVNGDRGYEGTNWHEVVMKKFSFQQNHTLSVSGGNQQTQYYLSARFNQDKGILNGDGLGYKAFNFQGNLTTKITDHLTATYQSSFDVNQRMGISTTNSEMNFWYYVGYSQPDIGPTTLDDPSHYTTANGEHWNPAAILDTDAMGYSKTKMNSYNNSLDLRYDAPFLKGLTLDAFASFNVNQRQTNLLDKAVDIYDYKENFFIESKGTSQYSESWNKSQQLYGKIQANYAKRFGDHNVSGMLAAEARLGWNSNLNASRQYGEFFTHDIINQGLNDDKKGNSGFRSSTAQAGYIARATYDYKGKYLAEVSGRLDGSYLYAPGHRWGFFPAYSLGWRVSEEPFFKNALPWMNNFKLRFSDGQTSLAQGSAYAWQLGYESNATSYALEAKTPVVGYYNSKAAETILSWQHVRMTDFGFDFEIKRGLIGGSVDWFWRNISGIQANSIYANSVPDFYGIDLPSFNLNKSQNVGIDLQLSHRHHIGKVNYRVTATATFTRGRQTHIESAASDTYGSHEAYYKSFMEGRWNNALSGAHYEWANGGEQFHNWAEIFDYNVYTGSKPSDLLPGMYKIDDRNGDGVINSSDQYYDFGATADAFGFSGSVGNNPPLQFGLMIFLNWKSFDMSATFSGATLDHKFISLSGPYGYGYFYKMYETYTDRYHLADGYSDPFDPQSEWVSGYWPALTTTSGGYTTWGNGTYRNVQPYNWINATYVRLKSIELGYTLPGKISNKVGIKSARVYVSGTNLLTFCNKLLKPYDPERNFGWIGGGGGAPIMKTYNFGVNINF